MPNIDINIKTAADTAGVEKATQSIDKLEKSADKNSDTLKKSGDKSTAAGTSMGKMGQLANQASYQVGDFAVQVGAGTSAITAFAQQAPQLLGAFQMAGVLSGPMTMALAAASIAIPIIAFGGRAIANSFGMGKTSVAEMTTNVDKLVTKIGEIDTQQLEKADTKAKQGIESAGLLAQKFTQVQSAEAAATQAAITSAQNNITAQEQLNLVLGLQAEKYREIDELANLHVEAINAAADAKIAEVNAQREAAVLDAWKATEDIKRSEAKKTALEAEYAAQRKILETIQSQNREREAAKIKRDQQSPLLDAAGFFLRAGGQVASGDFAGAVASVGAGDSSMTRRVQNAGEDAYDARTAEWRKNLEAGMRSRVDALLSNLEKATSDTETNYARFDNLQRKLNDADTAGAIKIGEIEQGMVNSKMSEQTAQLEKTAKQNATDASAFLSRVTATTAMEAAAYADAKQIVSDGLVSTAEMPRLMADMQKLIGSYQAGFMLMSGNMAENLRMGTTLQTQLADQVKLTREAGIQSAGVSADQKLLRAEFERWKTQQNQAMERVGQ